MMRSARSASWIARSGWKSECNGCLTNPTSSGRFFSGSRRRGSEAWSASMGRQGHGHAWQMAAVGAAASILGGMTVERADERNGSRCTLQEHRRVLPPWKAAGVLCEELHGTKSSRNRGESPEQLSESEKADKKQPPFAPPPSRLSGTREEKSGQDTDELYFGMFPWRQLWKPRVPYPAWDDDWDGREPHPSQDPDADRNFRKHLRSNGITRHIILIRHGQYDETHKEDEKRKLTALGREQAHITGMRLAELIRSTSDPHSEDNDYDDDHDNHPDKGHRKKTANSSEATPCHFVTLRVSDMTRAKETAAIIARHLPPEVLQETPDPLLGEGRPAHHIPGSKASDSTIQKTDEGHARIEQAFVKYFHRADFPPPESSVAVKGKEGEGEGDGERHEFEIIVCHANVIRYFLCRALQVPPEAWLRFCFFNCSLTYVTIRPSGSVSCRLAGDIGHLPYNQSTFSMHHGFNW